MQSAFFLHLPAGWSRILDAVMRIVKYDERESVVGDDDGLERVHLKSEQTEITYKKISFAQLK